MTKTEQVATVISDALGSGFSGRAWEKEGQARVYVSEGRKQCGYITVASNGDVDLSACKLPSSMHGKAEGWIVAELAKMVS